jgi:hypothetical protein
VTVDEGPSAITKKRSFALTATWLSFVLRQCLLPPPPQFSPKFCVFGTFLFGENLRTFRPLPEIAATVSFGCAAFQIGKLSGQVFQKVDSAQIGGLCA